MLRTLPLLFAALCTLSLGLFAAEPTPEQEQAQKAAMQKIVDSLHFKTGQIVLGEKLATLNLTDGFRYLDPNDTKKVLTDLWGNPSGGDTLGMIFPDNSDPGKEDSWAVVISFDDSGYVKDDDAAKLDYNKLLKQMQDAAKEHNPARVKAGYPPIELVGWATPPHYDKDTHKVYWAKQLRFGSEGEDTLNYCIRALGRRGVLELNVVATMPQLAQVEKAAPAILSMVDFEQGHRYGDFNASTDKVAEYGIAGLIAAGILAKTGLLAKLFGFLLIAKKFIVVAALAVIAGIKKFFARFSPPSQRNLDA